MNNIFKAFFLFNASIRVFFSLNWKLQEKSWHTFCHNLKMHHSQMCIPMIFMLWRLTQIKLKFKFTAYNRACYLINCWYINMFAGKQFDASLIWCFDDFELIFWNPFQFCADWTIRINTSTFVYLNQCVK